MFSWGKSLTVNIGEIQNAQPPSLYVVKDLVCYFLKIMLACGYCLNILFALALSEQESRTMEKGRLDSLWICKADTPVHHFLNCLVKYTQILKSSKLEVPNTLA